MKKKPEIKWISPNTIIVNFSGKNLTSSAGIFTLSTK